MAMSITSQNLQAILKELPEPQRASARKRILMADSVGWKEISLWVWNCTRKHESDLVGVNPKGEFRFIWWQDVIGEKR